MKLGIKVSSDPQSGPNLDATHAQAAEVWFNVRKTDDYKDLFEDLKKRKIDVGLHYWGALPDGTWTNLAYPDTLLISETKRLMKQTIDITASYGFKYVNIHPGSRSKVGIDFEKQSFHLMTEPVALKQSISLFMENALELHAYAQTRGITFTIESVPMRITQGWYTADARQKPMDIYELPVQVLIDAASHGLNIANDFTHTAANCISDSRAAVWDFLQSMTKRLVGSTKLVHLGFIIPPYNGTDFHDVLSNPLLETDQAIPNKLNMIELLQNFQNRDDMWIITEPKQDHVGNYFQAKEILTQSKIAFT